MGNPLKKINKTLEPYYALLTMLIFFGGLLVIVYKYIISPKDLRVSIQHEAVQYPSSILSQYEKLYDYTAKTDSFLYESTNVYNFLVKVTDYKRITLRNSSSHTLRNVTFKQLNVDELMAWGVTSDFHTEKELAEFRKNLQIDNARGIIFFQNAFDLPANSSVEIMLWGNFKPSVLVNDVLVTHDDGDAYIEKPYVISGTKGYIANYYLEILIILIVIFCIVYLVGIGQVKKRVGNGQTNP